MKTTMKMIFAWSMYPSFIIRHLRASPLIGTKTAKLSRSHVFGLQQLQKAKRKKPTMLMHWIVAILAQSQIKTIGLNKCHFSLQIKWFGWWTEMAIFGTKYSNCHFWHQELAMLKMNVAKKITKLWLWQPRWQWVNLVKPSLLVVSNQID